MTEPPANLEWWRVFAAICFLSISGTDKAVLASLADHANAKTGTCYPSEGRIAFEIGRDRRVVERSIHNLIRTPYLKRKRRIRTSSVYTINWRAILGGIEEFKGRSASYRLEKIELRSSTASNVLQEKDTRQKRRINTDRNVGSIPTETSDKHTHINSPKKKRNSVTAPPPCGGAASASLMPPVGKVKNLGGVVARVERAWRKKQIPPEQLRPWFEFLGGIFNESVNNYKPGEDPVAERALRVAGEIQMHLEERGEW